MVFVTIVTCVTSVSGHKDLPSLGISQIFRCSPCSLAEVCIGMQQCRPCRVLLCIWKCMMCMLGGWQRYLWLNDTGMWHGKCLESSTRVPLPTSSEKLAYSTVTQLCLRGKCLQRCLWQFGKAQPCSKYGNTCFETEAISELLYSSCFSNDDLRTGLAGEI